MAEQEHATATTAGRTMLAGNAGNGKNLTERAKPVMAMEDRPDMPVALIVKDWLDGANEHYRRAGHELTAAWAHKMLNLEEQRIAYMRRMLEALTK
jgi:hypothetical protein